MVFEKGNQDYKKGLNKRRSPELQKAYAERGKLVMLYNYGLSYNDIAKTYGINMRSAYRIINEGR